MNNIKETIRQLAQGGRQSVSLVCTVDAVDKTPYMAPDGSIAYNESIVKKLPPTPKRKDKI